MKTLLKRKALTLLTALFLLASCGQDNSTSSTGSSVGFNQFGGPITNGIGPSAQFMGGSTGNQTLDSIIQQVPCQGSQGPTSYSILGVSNQGGVTTVIQPNFSDIQNVYVGRNTYGDVVILRSMGSYSEMLIKVCARSFLFGSQMSLLSSTNMIVNVSRYCSVNEITSGQAIVRFTSQMGGYYDLPILPSALHLHAQPVSVCQNI